MDLRGPRPVFFATDLTNFGACRHLTSLERLAANGLVKRPYYDDPMLELLRDRGLAHEKEYVQRLRRAGRRVVEITRSTSALDATLAAMQDGADVVVQARLEHGSWAGWADVLLRVDGESCFGAWLYEPVETKLAKETRGATLIQLCLYADLLTALQGTAPECLRVVVPERKFEPEIYRYDEFSAYYRVVRRGFELELDRPLAPSADHAEPYPEPVAHCDVCTWAMHCEKRWRSDDHVSLVAGVQKTQRKELESWGVTTLAQLGELPLPLPRTPSRGSASAMERVREQARLQLEARMKGRPVYELLLPVEPNHGLAALPQPSALDVFLDLEGDRLAEHGGLDYLFGFAFRESDDTPTYEAIWAMSASEEKHAFEKFIDFVTERRRRDPGMHVYHYAPYEPTAMKRLMGRYGTRADELDDLLRAEVFVDLYGIVRKALRAGVESYSIKKLEPFYGLAREIDLRKVSRHLRAVEYAIAKKQSASLSSEIREAVRAYNKDDCLSALELRDWLERLRIEAEETGAIVPRPTGPLAPADEKVDERLAHIRSVSEALLAGLPLERDRTQQAQWILAHLLEWHRREAKVEWWEFFRLDSLSDVELLDEGAGIGELEYERRVETTPKGVVVDRYRFPPQETELEEGDDVYVPGQGKASRFAGVEAIDVGARTIDLRKAAARAEIHPAAVFKHERVSAEEAAAALLRLGEFVRDRGIDSAGPHRAARDLLLCRNPRLVVGEPFRRDGETTGDAARRLVLGLDHGVLAIQGPPGAGKTFTAARMIVELVRAKKKVGVTAVSHKVIRNLLKGVVEAAGDEGVSVRCMHRVSAKSDRPDAGIDEETDSKRAVAKIQAGAYDVVGGTAWVWPREELADSLDVLFVDEAGQMSLANVLACAQSARNLVLLGDPQQLEQPQKASHPDGTELSALEHLLEGHETMPPDRGLFLGETWRLHPSLCAYTSELFYESKLRPHDGLEAQRVNGPGAFSGAGLVFVPVVHHDNQNRSVEEAQRVAEIVHELTMRGTTWADRHAKVRPLGLDDILIVAPYNAQVSEIAALVPGARVGTVDKFQGQEAPIVIYSMTTSSTEDAPRGMAFLFSRHRLNVATSRAQGLCIVVASPELFDVECTTPEEMRMANAFARYLELTETR